MVCVHLKTGAKKGKWQTCAGRLPRFVFNLRLVELENPTSHGVCLVC